MIIIIPMWKSLSAEEDQEPQVEKKQDRYLAFIDYLGTETLYRDVPLHADELIERRNELEHGVQILLQSFIAAKKIEIGIFSDTVLIAGHSLPEVIRGASLLMRFVLKKSLDRGSWGDTRLLRGGFAKGAELRTSYLHSGPRVHVIPFFDGGLALAYQLEGVRKGSRLFFSKTLSGEELEDAAPFVFPWNSLSGMGDSTLDIHEFMWPAYLYLGAPLELADLAERAFVLWRRYLTEGNWPRAQYQKTLYHFDETVKCLLRSFISLAGAPDVDKAIAVCAKIVLPHDGDLMEDCDIRYLWGFWFQMLLVITTANLAEHYEKAIALTKKELVRRSYFDRFMAEAEYPEYAAMRTIFTNLDKQ